MQLATDALSFFLLRPEQVPRQIRQQRRRRVENRFAVPGCGTRSHTRTSGPDCLAEVDVNAEAGAELTLRSGNWLYSTKFPAMAAHSNTEKPVIDAKSRERVCTWFRIQSETMLRYYTAGESHGEALVAFLSGLPAGLEVDQAFLDRELWRRQQGYGRGGRMKIEQDRAHIVSGVRQSRTIGSPIAILLENRDWKNWQEALPVATGDPAKHKRVASPRPGHADL